MLQQGLKDGNRKDFEKAYNLYFNRVYGFILKSTFNESLTVDLVQDTFLKLWSKRSNISLELDLDHQLFVLAKNVIIDHYRKRVTQEKFINEIDIVQNDIDDNSTERDELIRKLHYYIEQLPPQQKEVFKLLKFRGLQYEEVSEKLNISKNTVSNHYAAAILFLKKHCISAIILFEFFP